MIFRLLKALAVVLVLAGVALYVNVRAELGQFAQIGSPTDVSVQVVRDEAGGSLDGAEDAAVDWVGRRVYIPAFDRRAAAAGKPVRGHIFVVSLDDPEFRAREITPAEPEVFFPHGTDLFREPGGAASLYVINHRGPSEAVEIFDLNDDGTLRHRETISDSGFISLNDLVVVAPRRFYVSNDHGHAPGSGFRRDLEDRFHTREANVVYFDGNVATPVAKWLNLADGVAMSHDGREIYVTELWGRTLRVYERNEQTGALTPKKKIPLGFGGDNIAVDTDGSLWIGGHPQLYKSIKRFADPSYPAPSQVARVDLAGPNVATLFWDDGTRVSAATGAIPLGDKMLLGSAFGPPTLVGIPK